jgi:hypothetical protein
VAAVAIAIPSKVSSFVPEWWKPQWSGWKDGLF